MLNTYQTNPHLTDTAEAPLRRPPPNGQYRLSRNIGIVCDLCSCGLYADAVSVEDALGICTGGSLRLLEARGAYHSIID